MKKIPVLLILSCFSAFSPGQTDKPSDPLAFVCRGDLKKETTTTIDGRQTINRDATEVVTDLAIDFSKNKILVQYGPMKVCNEDCTCTLDKIGFTCESRFAYGATLDSGLKYSTNDITKLTISRTSGIATFSRISSSTSNSQYSQKLEITSSDGRLLCVPSLGNTERPTPKESRPSKQV